MAEINIDGKISGGNVNVGGIQHIKNLTINNYLNIQPDEPQQIGVFLSYARADDDPDYDDPAQSFIRRLYNALSAAGFAVWWDRESLPSRGKTFTQEIEAAIRACQRFVLVVGPGAIASPYVRAEWKFALEQCKPITPILRAEEHESIPPEIAKLNSIDCRPSRQESVGFGDLIKRLNEDAPLGDPIGVKALPKGYFTRDEPFNNARDALCADAINPTVISAPPGGVALFGLGGIGKSTMATALAHDCQIRQHYHDGVLWVEVGQNPLAISLQAAVGMMLGDNRDNYQDETSATLSLSRTLHAKVALIVLDDVWDHKLVGKFPISGTACRLLITTRSRKLAEYVKGVDIPLNLLAEDEGARLIAGITGGDENNPRYKQISQTLGGHTLAITLAATQIKNGFVDDADEMLQLLQKRAAGPEPFRDLTIEDTDKDQNLALSLSLSYDALPNDELRRRFRQVGIFALESTFDRAALAAIWGDTDKDDARKPLKILEGAGLLDAEVGGRYSQHRLLHFYARALLAQEQEEADTFFRYTTHYAGLAKQFREVEVHQWPDTVERDLEHILVIGDTLVDRQNETALSNLALTFALHTASFVHYRPEFQRLSWLEMGKALNSKIQGPQMLPNEARLLTAMSYFLDKQGQYDIAFEHRKRVLEICEELNDIPLCAEAHKNLGRSYSIFEDSQQALPHLRQALSLIRESSNAGGEGAVLLELGDVHNDLDKTSKALSYYKQALKLLQKSNYKVRQPEVLRKIAEVYWKMQSIDQAVDYYDQAAFLCRDLGDRRGEAINLNSIGLAWSALGEKRKALDSYQQALVLFRAVGDRNSEAVTLFNMSFGFDDPQQAIDMVQQAYDIWAAIDSPYALQDAAPRLAKLRGGEQSQI